LTKPLYFYNGSTFELVGPTTPQSPIAYQTSAPTAPATGDLWIDSDGDVDTYNRQLTRYYFVATAAQTTITGTDANGLTLAYVAGSEAVYVNGALQVRGQDYTATNGTSVVLSSGLAVNDVVEIFAYTAFTVANAYTKAESDALPRGVVGKATTTTGDTTITTITDLNGLSVTFTGLVGRQYKVTVSLPQVYGTVANDRGTVNIANGSNTNLYNSYVNLTGNGLPITVVYLMTASGSTTVKVRASRDVGSGSINVYADSQSVKSITVEDIGVA
jgi:hypothetical protein